MNEQELKNLWQHQPLRTPAASPEALIAAVQKQASRFRGILDARDLRELAACAVVVMIFGVFYFTVYREPVSRFGVLVVIGSAIFIAWKLLHTRRSTPPASASATVVESLRAELNAVRAQSRLLGSVLWWYLLPLTIGGLIATWGLRTELPPKILCTVVFLAVDLVIYRLNQQARSNELLPLEAQLESLLQSAETGELPDETHIATLRPVVLSMAAANDAKPVEFTVAFSQIALYGVSGVVGIWFFLGVWHNNGKMEAPAVETAPQSIRIEEAKRYSFAAREVIDLINAGDYVAVQKRFNARMSNALPPEKMPGFFAGLASRYGRIETIEAPSGSSSGWVVFRLHGQKGDLTMSVALDREDKIAGLYFRPTPASSPARKSLLPELFSRKHFLWLVPFILGGLLYSWLIQKATTRAVGISSLGIHLQRGVTLILWDEIKEIRPLRILNIRSLWLIRESGRKTIMPWSSLERPADLKAAVERFAPPNHPLRQYVSLLRRL